MYGWCCQGAGHHEQVVGRGLCRFLRHLDGCFGHVVKHQQMNGRRLLAEPVAVTQIGSVVLPLLAAGSQRSRMPSLMQQAGTTWSIHSRLVVNFPDN
jgi:hypothetical protein